MDRWTGWNLGIIGGRDRSASINNRNPLAPQSPINRYKCIRFKLGSTSILDGRDGLRCTLANINHRNWWHSSSVYLSTVIFKDTTTTRDNFILLLLLNRPTRSEYSSRSSSPLHSFPRVDYEINRSIGFFWKRRRNEDSWKGANFRCIFPANGNYINRNSGAYEGCCHGDDEYFGTPPSSPPRDPKIRIPSFNREYKFYVCTPREISNISTVCPKN